MTKRENSYLALAIILLVVSLVSFLLSFFMENQDLEKKEINAKLVVANISGIDLNRENISFMLIPGTSQNRNLIITNNHDFSVRIFFKIYGNISRFLSFEDSVLFPFETGKIGIIASVPFNESYGEYAGRIIVITKKSI